MWGVWGLMGYFGDGNYNDIFEKTKKYGSVASFLIQWHIYSILKCHRRGYFGVRVTLSQ